MLFVELDSKNRIEQEKPYERPALSITVSLLPTTPASQMSLFQGPVWLRILFPETV